MDKIRCFIFIILAFGVQLYVCNRLEPQIKPVGSQVNYLNKEYIAGIIYTFRRVNETFNNINLYWNVVKTAPANVKLYLKVYVTDSTYQGGKLILDVGTPICTENKNRQLLPTVIIYPEDQLNTRCVKKGLVRSDTLQLYRFEVLVPELEKLGKYYRSEYAMGNETLTMFRSTIFSEWGYLNKN